MQARVDRVGARKWLMRLQARTRVVQFYADKILLYGVWVGNDRLGSGLTKGKAWKSAAKNLAKRRGR